MTQEEKELLLKDLFGRLPYGVKCCARFNTGSRYTANVTAICADRDYIETRQNDLHPYRGSSVEDIRLYLRPMSSMTEKENEELKYVIELGLQALEGEEGHNTVSAAPAAFEIDFYNKHHLDYRGLIEKGLALEAPEGMYI